MLIRSKAFCLGILLTMLAHVDVYGQSILQPIKLQEAEVNITIDGKLDEHIWSRLPVHNDIKVVSPTTFATPENYSELRFFYTEKGIYIGSYCAIPAEKRVKRLSRRDETQLHRDWFKIDLDTSGQGLYGYSFSLHNGGSKTDRTITENSSNRDWDGAWEGRTSETDQGWYAEMFLPWSMMDITAAVNKKLGLYIIWFIAHSGEYIAWPSIPAFGARKMTEYQPFKIEGVDPKQQYAFYPYVSILQDNNGNELTDRTGFDFFWRPSAGMQLSATYNPDFAQVESDDLIVNFTAVETLYQEKRPFFVEGREIFDTKLMNLVHTRRIGSAPDLYHWEADVNYELPGATDLQGAVQLTGQQDQMRYGLLAAREDDAHYGFYNFADDTAGTGVIDGRNFTALRLLYEDTAESYQSLGFISTQVQQESGDAKVNAVDVNYRSSDNIWNISSQFAYSEKSISNGSGFQLNLHYRPTSAELHRLFFEYYDDEFEINDFGFAWRNDFQQIYYQYKIREYDIPDLHSRETKAHVLQGYNTEGRLVYGGFYAERKWTYKNLSSFKLFGEFNPERWDDINSHDNREFRIKDRFDLAAEWQSNPNKKIAYGAKILWYAESLQGKSSEAAVTLKYRPTSNLSFSVDLDYNDYNGWLLYGDGDAPFRTYNARQWSPQFEANVFFTDKHQLDLRFQWVGLNGRANDIYQLNSKGTLVEKHFDDAGNLLDPKDYMLNYSDLAIQLRYKYEIAPLSDLYLVYVRGGTISDYHEHKPNMK